MSSSSSNGILGGLGAVRDVLVAFGSAPAGFILGTVLATVVSGVETVTTLFVDGLRFVFLGSEPGTAGRIGLADLPTLVGELLTDAARPLGRTVLRGSGTVSETLISLSESAGPLAPVVLAALAVVTMTTLVIVTRFVVARALDLIPGLGGIA